ncbi:type II TA system antitoxin MqsA family protein [Anaeromyxobacter paludicola]|uniref:HTH cro/C1-type domain-containing protein n=1 Tax=Anaeromyxobacter paludicola TaxID=2918171 RepID=A0ABM7X9N2_9BACT|nr:type II TA system antitoxin MqsA family protein [Anaeromyxobacter paludicola]BDG08543.1 hypothetical protein AMPC_16560 [Anaeromyxobacter paludicola]
MSGRRCRRCEGELREVVQTIPVALPRCDVRAEVAAPARRCAACGEAHVDPAVLSRAHLSVGCALADEGVQTGGAFRHMRRALGLRAADLARLLDLTPETLSHWETGKVRPSRAAFVALAAMLEDALAGRTTTRDRLQALARERPRPGALSVVLRGR